MKDASHIEPETHPPPGTILEGRYRLTGLLGRGGVAWVLRAQHLQVRRPVAVKMLRETFRDHPQVGPRFEREAHALASLRHPHIVSLIDYSCSEDGHPYLVTELLQGSTVADLLDREGRLEPERALRIARQILDALIYAHGQGFVHRDIKPGNVFLQHLPTDPDHVKLLDFGFVQMVNDDFTQRTMPEEEVAFGTPGYMAPEQATGAPTSARSDIYSLGILIFEMLAGRRPYVGDIPDVVRQHMHAEVPPLSVGGSPLVASPPLRAFLERALAKAPKDRFPSASAQREAIDALLVGGEPLLLPESDGGGAAAGYASPGTVRPVLTPVPLQSALRSIAHLRSAALVASLLAVLVTAFLWWPSPRVVAGPAVLSTSTGVGSAPGQPARGRPGSGGPGAGRAVAERTAQAGAAEPIGDAEGPNSARAKRAAAARDAEAREGDGPGAPEGERWLTDAAQRAGLGGRHGDPWRTRLPVYEVDGAREDVLAGRRLSPTQLRALHAFAVAHPHDPRPHLVMALAELLSHAPARAMRSYERALEADERAAEDADMLNGLLTLVTYSDVSRQAAHLVKRLYARGALSPIHQALLQSDLSEVQRARLRMLRAHVLRR